MLGVNVLLGRPRLGMQDLCLHGLLHVLQCWLRIWGWQRPGRQPVWQTAAGAVASLRVQASSCACKTAAVLHRPDLDLLAQCAWVSAVDRLAPNPHAALTGCTSVGALKQE